MSPKFNSSFIFFDQTYFENDGDFKAHEVIKLQKLRTNFSILV